MRLLVLSRLRFLYSTRRFREAAAARGHAIKVVDPLACAVVVDGDRPRLLHGDDDLAGWDAAIPRIGTSGTAYAVAVVEQLEAMGVAVVNRAAAIVAARDKLLALQRLAAAGLAVPRTVLVRAPDDLDRALSLVGGPPVVLKLVHGSQGVGVILADSRAAVEATLDTLWGLGQNVLVQEFVRESRGRDVRALVLGGRVIAAMRRVARPGEWRSNIHRGGAGIALDLDPAYERAALAAARVVGLDLAGVDLLETRDGPRVLEVNASPGFEGLESASGADIAGAIVDHAEARVAGGGPALPVQPAPGDPGLPA